MKRQIVSALLAAALTLSLAACGKDQPAEPSPAPSGSYVEEDITPDHNNALALTVQTDGAVQYLTGPAGEWGEDALPDVHWYTLAPGAADWRETPGHAFADVLAQTAELPRSHRSFAAAFAADGTLYWRVDLVDEDRSVTESRYFRAENDAAVPVQDLPAETAALLDRENVFRAAVTENSLLVQTTAGTLTARDRAGQEQKIDLPALEGQWLLGGWQDSYYTIDTTTRHVYRYVAGGTTAEDIFDGTRFRLGGSLGLRHSAAGADGTLYVCLSDGDSTSQNHFLCRYRWDGSAPALRGGHIRVFSLYETDTLYTAIGLVQQSGYTVDYAFAVSADQQTPHALTEQELTTLRQDALRQLNAQLLAGQGPDVLILDDMDVESLIRQGLLADLDGLVETEALLPNLAGTYRDDNGLWALPTRCYPYLVGGGAQTVAAVKDVTGLARAIAESPAAAPALMTDYRARATDLACYFYDWQEIFETFYPLYAARIWQGGVFNGEAFGEFLALTAPIAHHWGDDIGKSAEGVELGNRKAGHLGANSTLGSYLNAEGRLFCGPVYFMEGLDELFYSRSESDVTPEGNAGELAAMTAADVTCVDPAVVAGISAHSKDPAGAARFLAALLSEEAQGTRLSIDGLPVHAGVLTEQWRQALDAFGTRSDTDLAAVIAGMTPTPLLRELKDAAWAGTWEYFNGASQESAAATTKAAAELWLAEQ